MPQHFSSSQLRAARALLNWSRAELAKQAGISEPTLHRLENDMGEAGKSTQQKILQVLSAANIEFLKNDGVRKRPEEIKVYEGPEDVKIFFDSIFEHAKNKGLGLEFVRSSSRGPLFSPELADYRKAHIERMMTITDRLKIKCILTGGITENDMPTLPYIEYRSLPKQYAEAVSFYVYDDKYAIALLDVDPSPKITVIQSRTIANAFRHQFYSMWKHAAHLGGSREKTIKR